LRKSFSNPNLKESYRSNPRSFSRNRKLPFSTMAVLILQKSVKSLQVKLNEFFDHIQDSTVTAGAYTQARANLSPLLFKDLNRECYTEGWYADGVYKRYKGHRLLAIDGSKIRLPESASVREEFGTIRIKNQHGEGSYTGGQCSVMYDVLNECILDSELAPGRTSELELALGHIEFCKKEDLILFDRGYPGYELFATLQHKNVDFVCRCSKTAFGAVQDFISQTEEWDKIVTLSPGKDVKSKVAQKRLPVAIKIRLVKIILSTGETEILATSLLERSKYPLTDFSDLYALRWGVETFFNRIKNRLSLENFSGKTAIAVKQDFYSTILITNVESEITGDVDNELKENSNAIHPQKVRKTISFNAIKHRVIELLFCSDLEYDAFVEQLQQLFRKNTIPIRNHRTAQRKTTIRRALHFHQRLKKAVF
jgi:hypothetical protein